MSELYSVIGTQAYSNLLADPTGADVIGVPCEPGNGALKAGTVLYRKSTGLYAPAGTSQISTSYQLVVLKEDVDTGTTVAPGAVAEDAAAYRAGCFVEGVVKYNDSGTMTKVTEAHKVVLRLLGIVFDKEDASGASFDNSTVTITYIANTTAEQANVAEGAVKGSTYTILANSVTDFDAPAGKTFSKWNTKADGTGTDYAAAASYTASANLTLYAVWANAGG